jgi:iron complex outermembrane receptor protein
MLLNFSKCLAHAGTCRRGRLLRSGATSLVMIVASGGVHAQTATTSTQPTPPATTGASSGPQSHSGPAPQQLETIIVTAQKRRQNVQNTPLTVTTFSGRSLQAAGVTKVEDLQNVNPSLNISAQGDVQTVFMRGLGNSVTTVGNEASVPIYIDDVYYVNADTAYLDLPNISRVEALEGPQGTLFGRNASSGVVSIYTRDPGPDRVLEATFGYASYNDPSIQLYASSPITNNLAADFSLSWRDQYGGWGVNLVPGDQRPTYRAEDLNLRSKVIWKPTDETTVKLIAYYVESSSEQSQISSFYSGTYGGGLDATGTILIPPQFQNGFYNTNLNTDERVRSHSVGGSGRIDQDLGFADLTSITAARYDNEFYIADGDGTQFPISEYDLHAVDRQYSEEVQIKSKPDLPYSWILGAYYLNAVEGYDPTAISGVAYGGGTILGKYYPGIGLSSIDIVGEQRTQSYAGFGQGTVPVPFIPDTKLTFGLRYTVDAIHGFGQEYGDNFEFPLPGTLEDNRQTFHKLTEKVALDHHFTKDIMGYFSYSVGYKAGLYNTLPMSAEALKPEVNNAYEVGLKTELLDHTLRVNGDLFRSDVTNPQVQSSQNGLEVLLNAQAARSQGAEAQADALLAEGLHVRVSGTYLDSYYTGFTDAPEFLQRPEGGAEIVTIDATGRQLPRASKFKFVGGVNYEYDPETIGNFNFDLNAEYTSKFYWDPANNIAQNAFVVVNSSLSYTPAAFTKVRFTFWVRNLTGAKYYSNEYEEAATAGFAATPAAPRVFGGLVHFAF